MNDNFDKSKCIFPDGFDKNKIIRINGFCKVTLCNYNCVLHKCENNPDDTFEKAFNRAKKDAVDYYNNFINNKKEAKK